MTPDKLNINVGVLGHVDSGKTSLCKILSTTASTAAFDANPQSKERGITLDLGFSSLSLESPSSGSDDASKKFNFTLVDCPGHSSLIRTVIGGAQIMDIMLLIIDINKGMQSQAAECLILAQIASSHLIVVLNKMDLVPVEARKTRIAKINKLMRSTLSKTKFGNEPIVSVSAVDASIGTEELKSALLTKVQNSQFERNTSDPFLMAIDHCFTIKGQGTIVTGTVLQGTVRVNDMVEFPSLRETKKVKSMQSFRISVNEAKAGDRIGMCVPGLDSAAIERTVVSAVGVVRPSVRAGIIVVNKIPFFKKPIESKKKYHISIGYDTVTAKITLFQQSIQQAEPRDVSKDSVFDTNLSYEYVEHIGKEPKSETSDADKKAVPNIIYGLLEFDRPVMATPSSLLIGSDLQSEDENACRLAFSSHLIDFTQDKNYAANYLPQLKVFKEKYKQGTVDRVVSDNQLIAKGFCKKESNIDYLIGLKVSVTLSDDSSDLNLGAKIDSRFGQTNKVRLSLAESMSEQDMKLLKTNVKQAKVLLNFKKYFFGADKKSKLAQ